MKKKQQPKKVRKRKGKISELVSVRVVVPAQEKNLREDPKMLANHVSGDTFVHRFNSRSFQKVESKLSIVIVSAIKAAPPTMKAGRKTGATGKVIWSRFLFKVISSESLTMPLIFLSHAWDFCFVWKRP